MLTTEDDRYAGAPPGNQRIVGNRRNGYRIVQRTPAS